MSLTKLTTDVKSTLRPWSGLTGYQGKNLNSVLYFMKMWEMCVKHTLEPVWSYLFFRGGLNTLWPGYKIVERRVPLPPISTVGPWLQLYRQRSESKKMIGLLPRWRNFNNYARIFLQILITREWNTFSTLNCWLLKVKSRNPLATFLTSSFF